jgi:hypothetical protein
VLPAGREGGVRRKRNGNTLKLTENINVVLPRPREIVSNFLSNKIAKNVFVRNDKFYEFNVKKLVYKIYTPS